MAEFLLLALATWRISSLLVHEAGPGHIFVRIRSMAGVKYSPDTFQQFAPTMLAEVFLCVWCMSIYIGTGWALFYYLFPKIAVAVALPLFFSAVSILLDERVQTWQHQQ